MSCISFGVSSSLQVPAPGCFSSVEGLLEVQRRIGPLGSCSWRSRLLGQCPHHMRCRSPCGSELGWKPFHGFSGALENLTCRVCRVRFFFRGQVLQVRQTRTDRGWDSQFQHVSTCFSMFQHACFNINPICIGGLTHWMQTCAISDSWLFGTSRWIGWVNIMALQQIADGCVPIDPHFWLVS